MKMSSKRGSGAKHQAQGMSARGEWRTDKEARGWKSVQLGILGCQEGGPKVQLWHSGAGESAPKVCDKVELPGGQRGDHHAGRRLVARRQELGPGFA